MYNIRMKGTEEIHFSQARQRLSALVDAVETTGKPVKILRHGKVAAVLIGVQEYIQKFEKKTDWKLAGSLIPVQGVDLENSLRQLGDRNAGNRRRSLERSAKEFSKA